MLVVQTEVFCLKVVKFQAKQLGPVSSHSGPPLSAKIRRPLPSLGLGLGGVLGPRQVRNRAKRTERYERPPHPQTPKPLEAKTLQNAVRNACFAVSAHVKSTSEGTTRTRIIQLQHTFRRMCWPCAARDKGAEGWRSAVSNQFSIILLWLNPLPCWVWFPTCPTQAAGSRLSKRLWGS